MLKDLESNKLLWIILAVLSFFASAVGVIFQSIYERVTTFNILPGIVSQDVVTVVSSVALFVIAFTMTERDVKKQIIAMSLVGYLFYGYGIWVIEQIYNPMYLLYIVIFGLSFWTLVYNIVSIKKSDITYYSLTSSKVKQLAVGVSVFTAVLFYFLWTVQLIPLMQTGNKIEFMYSIYVLDMCFVLPAFLLTAFLLFKNYNLGLVLMPILFFKGFALLFSVGLGGLIKPFYNMEMPSDTWFYLGLSIIYLFVTILFLRNMRINDLNTK